MRASLRAFWKTVQPVPHADKVDTSICAMKSRYCASTVSVMLNNPIKSDSFAHSRHEDVGCDTVLHAANTPPRFRAIAVTTRQFDEDRHRSGCQEIDAAPHIVTIWIRRSRSRVGRSAEVIIQQQPTHPGSRTGWPRLEMAATAPPGAGRRCGEGPSPAANQKGIDLAAFGRCKKCRHGNVARITGLFPDSQRFRPIVVEQWHQTRRHGVTPEIAGRGGFMGAAVVSAGAMALLEGGCNCRAAGNHGESEQQDK